MVAWHGKGGGGTKICKFDSRGRGQRDGSLGKRSTRIIDFRGETSVPESA